MKFSKAIVLSLAAFCAAIGIEAQDCPTATDPLSGAIGYLEINPVDVEINPIKIFIDLKEATHGDGILIGQEGPIYLWSWSPEEPAVGNGAWEASNAALEMTPEGDDVWSYTIENPLEFYGTDNAQRFYECGINCLAKLADGNPINEGDPEMKTNDIHIEVLPPPGCEARYCAFPRAFELDDYVTLTYNNSSEVELDANLQNMGSDEAYLYIAAKQDAFTFYEVVSILDANTEASLNLTQIDGEPNKFTITILPEDFLNIPEGASIESLEVQILRAGQAFTGIDLKSFPLACPE